MLFGPMAAVDNDRPSERQLPVWVGYLLAFALEAAVTGVLLLIQPYLPLGAYPVYYFLTTMVVAYYFGAGPAALAVVIGLLAYEYFFVPPLRTLLPHAETPAAWAGIVAYIVGTSIVAVATVLIRRSKRRVERTAERLRESEASLRVQRQLLETVINNIPAEINLMRGSDLRIELINPAYQAIAPGKEMVGRTLDEVWPELDRDFTALCRRVLETGETYEVVDDPVDISRYPGGPTERRYFTWSLIPVDLPGGEGRGILNMSVETTERKKAEEAVLSQAELLQAIIDNIPVYLVIWDGRLRQFTFNEAFRRETGWTEADTSEGDFMEKVYPDPEYRRQVEEFMQSLEPGFRDLKTTIRDGTTADVAWANVHLSDERSVGIGVNISDRKKAEEALAARAREIQEANEQLAAANEELAVTNEELECATEELRVEVQERKKTEEALREEQEHKLVFYRRTIEAATSGKLIVTDRTEIEKLAGPPLATWRIHSREDIQAVRHEVEKLARKAGINEPRLGKLTVAVGEAVTNAVKHAQSGDASFHRADDFIVVLVSDRGPGIPAIALPDVALRPGYSTAGTLGMGYKMMIQFSDKVCLATGDQGTTVGIEMKRG